MQIDQGQISCTYRDLFNGKWVETANLTPSELSNLEAETKHTRVFDSETLVPIPYSSNITAFMATVRLPRCVDTFRRHQTVRMNASRAIWPEMEKLLIHFKNRNWMLFDSQAKALEFQDARFSTYDDRLIFVVRALEYFGRFFNPEISAADSKVRQRIALAETTSESSVSTLLKYLRDHNRAQQLWDSFTLFRRRYYDFYPALSGVYNVYYWDERKNSLDDYTIAEKLFEKLKSLYVDGFETLCRVSVIAAVLECVISNSTAGVKTPSRLLTIDEFALMPNGNKETLLRGLPIEGEFVPLMDHRLRNGLGHYSASYDVTTDRVYYENQNTKGVHKMHISYIRFCEKIIRLYAGLEAVFPYCAWGLGRSEGVNGRIV